MIKEYSVYIIDDNQHCIDRLVEDLKNFPQYDIIGTSVSLMKAMADIKANDIDLLFMDVEMPEGNGFDFLKLLDRNNDMKVVMYSAHNEYIINALRESTFDFLQKPYTSDELEDILNRFENQSEPENYKSSESIDNSKTKALRAISGLVLANVDDIFCFNYSADTHYWSAILRESDKEIRLIKQTSSKNILAISEKFVQINPNNIINIDYLYFIESSTMKCLFKAPFQDYALTASRRCYSKLKSELDIL